MPRMRRNRQGLFIARPGGNVDNIGDLQFSPATATQAILLTGTVVPSAYTLPGAPGEWQAYYNRAEILYGKTFAVPPLVYVGFYTGSGFGVVGDNVIPIAAAIQRSSGAVWGVFPQLLVESRVDRCIILARRTWVEGGYIRYYVTENQLQ